MSDSLEKIMPKTPELYSVLDYGSQNFNMQSLIVPIFAFVFRSLKGFLSVHATNRIKTQETFKKNSGYMNVRCVTNDFLFLLFQRQLELENPTEYT